MRIQGLKFAALAATVIATAGFTTTARAAFNFSDTFNGGSNLNSATPSAPTATSTSYEAASTKNSTDALTTGDLKISMAATTSGVVEAQALFSTAPITLATAGDNIELTLTFTDTNNILAGGAASAVYVGLYNAGGVAPASGLQSSGLNATAGSASYATGGTALWQGYTTRVTGSTGSNQVYTRPQQNGAGTASANQDLVGNGAGGGLYNNPTGTVFNPQPASTVALTNASQYTDDLLITLNADGTLTISSNLYSGAGTTGTNLATNSVTAPAGNVATFDGLAFGYRQSGTSVATQLDANSLTVQSNVTPAATPEPASVGLLALGAASLLARRRKA